LALLDDPLGALDASTAFAVFNALFGAPRTPTKEGCDNDGLSQVVGHGGGGGGGVLRCGGTVLVTHAAHLLSRPEISRVVLLEADGKGRSKVAFNGSWADLKTAALVAKPRSPLAELMAAAATPHDDDATPGTDP
jgi:hypothetical protein